MNMNSCNFWVIIIIIYLLLVLTHPSWNMKKQNWSVLLILEHLNSFSNYIGICTNKYGQCCHKIQFLDYTFAHSFGCNTEAHIYRCIRQPHHSIFWAAEAMDPDRTGNSTCIVETWGRNRLWPLVRGWPCISHHIADNYQDPLCMYLLLPYFQL